MWFEVTDKYILDEHHGVHPQPDLLKWAKWMETRSNKIVKQDDNDDGVRVSTIFLGLDHRFWKTDETPGPPLVFETMIFGGMHDQEQWRCCTWADALTQHAHAKAIVGEFG